MARTTLMMLTLTGMIAAALPVTAQSADSFPSNKDRKACNYNNPALDALNRLDSIYQNNAPTVEDKNLIVSYANTLIACCEADKSGGSNNNNWKGSTCLCHSPNQASAVTKACG
ncbi:hypothetical protein [Tropicimonas aquimaris]|uniref:Uncharacterized protein n=1 Tax=Tropicimonas aquimaris TaxID=914152 RepID=A0ABW3IWB4_9RHOB